MELLGFGVKFGEIKGLELWQRIEFLIPLLKNYKQ